MKTRRIVVDPREPDPAAIQDAAATLKAGGLVAFPTETVYGLGAVATDAAAVQHVFAAKGRPEEKPLIVHLSRQEQIHAVVRELPPIAQLLMEHFFPGPLTLVLRKHPSIPAVVTAGGDTVGVRMPDYPVARALIDAVGEPLAAPSANLSGKRSSISAEDVLADLEGRIDLVLDAGPSPLREPSTVLDLTVTPPRILRQGSLPADALRALIAIQ